MLCPCVLCSRAEWQSPLEKFLFLHLHFGMSLLTVRVRACVRACDWHSVFWWCACRCCVCRVPRARVRVLPFVSVCRPSAPRCRALQTCPVMSAGAKYEYHWADGVAVKKPIRCSAPEYIDYLMTWIQMQLDDQDLFPTTMGVPFPKSFMNVAKTIHKRLFRVYAHIYHTHFDKVCYTVPAPTRSLAGTSCRPVVRVRVRVRVRVLSHPSIHPSKRRPSSGSFGLIRVCVASCYQFNLFYFNPTRAIDSIPNCGSSMIGSVRALG